MVLNLPPWVRSFPRPAVRHDARVSLYKATSRCYHNKRCFEPVPLSHCPMIPFPHRHLGRAALALVLVLATQLAFAGQVCRAVMVSGAGHCRAAHASVPAVEVMVADAHAFPCVDDASAPVGSCFGAIGSKDATVTASGSVPQFDSAPPMRDYPVVAILGASLAPIPLPTSSVGPPLRVYILFSRFLS